MLLPIEIRESLVMALDEYFETENDDPDSGELASTFVRLLQEAAEEADIDEADEIIILIEEEAELDESLADTLAYAFGRSDDLELSGEEVVSLVEKLGLLEWDEDEDMLDEIDDLDLEEDDYVEEDDD